MAIGLLDPGSQQLNQTQVVTATGTNDTFTFQSPPPGLQWTGTLQCASAPTGAVFAAVIGGTSWGEWGGNSVYGPVQAQATQQLVVTVNGLVAGQVYVLLWIGSSDPSHLVQPLYPSANSTALFAQTQAVPPSVIGGPVSLSVGFPVILNVGPVALTVRTLIVTVQIIGTAFVPNVEVLGNASGFIYYNQAAYLGATNSFICVVPVTPGFDSSYQVTVSSHAGSALTVEVSGDNTQYDESVFYNGQPVSSGFISPAAATVLATGPCRLLHAWMEVSSAQSASIQAAGGAILRATGTTMGNSYREFDPPQPFIIPAGSTVVTATGTCTSAGVVTAYP